MLLNVKHYIAMGWAGKFLKNNFPVTVKL